MSGSVFVKGIDIKMDLQIIEKEFSVYKVKEVKKTLWNEEFVFVSRTDQELSLICENKWKIEDAQSEEHGWKCFRIAEDASFEKYGMIAFLSEIIAKEKTCILVVGTFDTDYIFIKKDKFDHIIAVLSNHGCCFL